MPSNQKFSTLLSDDEKIMAIIIESPYYPVALNTDGGKLVFADIDGNHSNAIPVPAGVMEIEGQMLWSSPDWIFHVPVPSKGWIDMGGHQLDPVPPLGLKRVISRSTPHTPSYAGGDGSDMTIQLETVIREGDLPFRRDERGTWTASGLLLQFSSDIPLRNPFQIYDLEREAIIRIEGIAKF